MKGIGKVGRKILKAAVKKASLKKTAKCAAKCCTAAAKRCCGC